LATHNRMAYRAFEAEQHRARGELLIKRDPSDTGSAEEALKCALDVARAQQTRSFELRAALSLAKLYQSTGRPADAHAALAPALEGFSPTPEMPEIAEAQALLATLAETNEVKAVVAQRERRIRLQTSYGQAVMWSKGFAAEETRAAFAHARELSRLHRARQQMLAMIRCIAKSDDSRGAGDGGQVFVGGERGAKSGVAERRGIA
jgi:hypothetical protein